MSAINRILGARRCLNASALTLTNQGSMLTANGYAQRDASTGLDSETITYSIWVKFGSTTTEPLIFYGTTGSVVQWYLHSDSTLKTSVRNSTNNITHTSTGTLSDAVWMHLAFTYDGSGETSGLIVYQNGAVLAGSVAEANNLTTLASGEGLPIAIGRFPTQYASTSNYDQATIWHCTMSAAEISELYNSGTPDHPLNHSQSANLKAWWPLGENSDTGSVFYDLTSGGNDLNNNSLASIDSGDIP